MRVTPLLASRTILVLFSELFISNIKCSAQSPTQALTSISSPTAPASGSQHFIHPAKNDVLTLGGKFIIRWIPITHYKNVTLQLWDNSAHGFSHDLLTSCSMFSRKTCGNIATHVPNTGSFEWAIPNPVNGTNNSGHSFPRGQKLFWLKMFVEDYVQDAIGNKEPVVTYSQGFAFAKEGESGTTVSVDVSTLMVAGGLPLETVSPTDSRLDGSGTDSGGRSKTTTGRLGISTASVTKKPSTKNNASTIRGTDTGLRAVVGLFVTISLLLSAWAL